LKNIRISIIVYVFIAFLPLNISGQLFKEGLLQEEELLEYDTLYIESYVKELTTRLYTSRKFTILNLSDKNASHSLEYRPNDNLNLGFGATYYGFTLNIGLNLPFINDDDELYGKTSYLDLQSHLLTRKFTFELWLSVYNGYHVANPNSSITDWDISDNYPYRQDMQTFVGGFSSYYIFNNKKFSYRAAFVQDEWQKKSAGSFLIGGSLYEVNVIADSSLLPYNIVDTSFYDGFHFNQSNFATISINGGYAHSFIIKRKFFITLSLLAGVGGGNTSLKPSMEDMGGTISHTSVNTNLTFRFAMGYNSRKIYVGLSNVYSSFITPTPIEDTDIGLSFGNVRFNIVRRFNVKKQKL